ncbi:MAG: nucleotidyltransferase family protein [Anaerolineae bacterium]|nr:nucleotidyltransferase family protein [Anaerolineae bacterium]
MIEKTDLVTSIHPAPAVAAPSPPSHIPPSRVWMRVTADLLAFMGGSQEWDGWSEEEAKIAPFAALVNCVASWLHNTLAGTPLAASLPTSFLEYLSRQHQANRARIERLQADAARILAAATRAGIPVIPLKGAAMLAGDYYPQPGLRPMADLDLLVPAKSIAQTTRLMEELGYTLRDSTWKHHTFLRPDNERVVAYEEHPDNPRPVEIHHRTAETLWGLLCDLTARAWERARPRRFLGVEALMLPPSELLLHVAVHATFNVLNHTARLVHLADIRQLAQVVTTQGEWDDVTRGWGRSLVRFAYPAIGLAAYSLPGSIPPPVLSALEAQVSPRLVRWVASGPIVSLSRYGNAPRFFLALRYMPLLARSPMEAIAMVFNSTFPPRWYLAERYPNLARSRWLPIGYLLLGRDRVRQARDELGQKHPIL